MVYSIQQFPNKEYEFPPPPLWLTWVQGGVWRNGQYHNEGDGQVRHQSSLQKAKKYISGYGGRYHGGLWVVDWAIYKWENDRYVLQYQGKQGETKKDHPLWLTKLGKAQATVRDLDDDELAATLASIQAAL